MRQIFSNSKIHCISSRCANILILNHLINYVRCYAENVSNDIYFFPSALQLFKKTPQQVIQMDVSDLQVSTFYVLIIIEILLFKQYIFQKKVIEISFFKVIVQYLFQIKL